MNSNGVLWFVSYFPKGRLKMTGKLLAVALGTGLAVGLLSLGGCGDNTKKEPVKNPPAGHTDDGHSHTDGDHHEGDGHTHENEKK